MTGTTPGPTGRIGSAVWTGELPDGAGQVTVGADAWQAPYSYRSRFADGNGTNPEELLAACFSMALTYALTAAGATPRSVSTTARVHLRPVDGRPTITRVDLHTTADVTAEEDTFQRSAEEAKRGCALSRALAGVGEIRLVATLSTPPR